MQKLSVDTLSRFMFAERLYQQTYILEEGGVIYLFGRPEDVARGAIQDLAKAQFPEAREVVLIDASKLL